MDIAKFFGDKFVKLMDDTKRGHSKIYQEVFDQRSFKTLEKLYYKKAFDYLDSLISTGKEANVFLAIKGTDTVAIKIFRRETTSFNNFLEYVEGDPRFYSIKKTRTNISNLMTQKEYRNLKIAEKHKISVPQVKKFLDNIVIMESIGDSNPEPTLDKIPKSIIKQNKDVICKEIEENLFKLKKAKLVHGDLSEYNMIFKDKVYFIDMSQSVTFEHPHAQEYYLRDLKNIKRFFDKFNYNSKKIDKEIEDVNKCI